ncbi:unnamed protein product [Sphagnum jensenii]|uniref:Secreted protein n=1 Tax=Sphagnum jensenii TaxID=128206 RepID=A0ABP1A9E4_9BRYO
MLLLLPRALSSLDAESLPPAAIALLIPAAAHGLQEEKSKDFGFRVEAGVSLKSSSPAAHLVARTSAHFSSSASDAAATLDFCLRRSACQETPSTFLDSL